MSPTYSETDHLHDLGHPRQGCRASQTILAHLFLTYLMNQQTSTAVLGQAHHLHVMEEALAGRCPLLRYFQYTIVAQILQVMMQQ